MSGPTLATVIVNVTVSPGFGVPLSTDLVTDRSATWALSEAVAMSSSPTSPLFGVESWSNCPAAVISAVLSSAPVASTVAVTVSVALAPLASVGTDQTSVVSSYVPVAVVAVPNESPALSVSVTSIAVASSGPSLVRVTVKVTVSPTLGAGSSTVLVSDRSAAGATVSTASSWSSWVASLSPGVESGSPWSEAATCATFVIVPLAVTVATMSMLATPPSRSVPTVQVPATGSNAPPLSSLTYAKPLGSVSDTMTPVAVSGPPLATVTVNVTVSPTSGVVSLTAFVRLRSASRAVTDALS